MAPPLFRQGGAKLSNGPPTICAPKRENKWYFLKNSPAALNWLYFTQNVRLRLKISCVLRKNFACGAKSVVFYSELLDIHNFCTKIQKFFGGFVPMKPCWPPHYFRASSMPASSSIWKRLLGSLSVIMIGGKRFSGSCNLACRSYRSK